MLNNMRRVTAKYSYIIASLTFFFSFCLNVNRRQRGEFGYGENFKNTLWPEGMPSSVVFFFFLCSFRSPAASLSNFLGHVNDTH